MKKEINIGDRFKSNTSGEYTIIDFKCFPRNEFRNDGKYLCEFDEINGVKFRKWSSKKEILSGVIKNIYYPRIYGVGYIGEIKGKKDIHIYAIWIQMLKRCYVSSYRAYKYYGAKGITVCDRWLNYTNFYNDYINMEGYEKNKRQDLDKDIKQQGVENKIYSPETCVLINPSENIKEMTRRCKQKYFLACSPNGEFFIDNNVTEFRKKHNLPSTHITVKSETVSTSLWKYRKLSLEETNDYILNNIVPKDIFMIRTKDEITQSYCIGKNNVDNKNFIFYNIYKFSNDNNINYSGMSSVINNKQKFTTDKTDKNIIWKFRKLTEDEVKVYLTIENHNIQF